jgi:uncharacterized phage-associated protein
MSKIRAIDVADYILSKGGSMSAMKLQKLVYYSQAWHLVWEEEPLFNEEIQAWANGPVVPKLYSLHQGHFKLDSAFFKGDTNHLASKNKNVINKVLEFYGKKNPQWLSDLTHMEEPWKNARKGLADGERGNHAISIESMAEYYGSL